MEWDHERCLQLIELYRRRPELWHSRHSLYRVLSKKQLAWNEIANEIGASVDVVKGKMNSLLASFRRERSKEMRATSGTETECGEEYKSQWFAYEALQFLYSKNVSRRPPSTVEKKIKSEEENPEDIDIGDTVLDEASDEMEQESASGTNDQGAVSWGKVEPELANLKEFTNTKYNSKRSVGIKRKLDNDRADKDDYRIVHSIGTMESCNQRNSCDVYGEHIALKLRSYSRTTQSAVQHLFGNILFKADMGVYDRELHNYHSSSEISSRKPRSPSPAC